MLSWKRRDGETGEAQRKDGVGRDVISLLTLWPTLPSSLYQEEPSWGGRMGLGRRQRLLTELGRVGARAAPHEVRHSFAVDFPGLRQTGARM